MKKIGGFPREFVDEVKFANNIVDVASRYMQLRERGRQHWGLCPFHHEKTPSFAINEQQQFFKCFGCGESGTVITLVKQMESLNFPEAVEKLAEWANIPIPIKSVDPEYLVKKKHRERILACLEEARKYYVGRLNHCRGAAPAPVDYLHARGITNELIEKFSIGLSDSWDGVITHLKKLGFTEREMLDSGVVAKSEKGRIYDAITPDGDISSERRVRLYDAMGERITFAIFNIYGSCIGFTGRTLSDKTDIAKYRNTSQTIVFDKSNIVYGIDVLKSAKRTQSIDGIIVVEGNVDVITLVGAGFVNTLAIMGTALTPFHAKVFARFSPNVYVCFDGDDSGQKAALRGVDILAKEGLAVRVIQMPKNIDPDSFVTQNGALAFQQLVKDAKPYIDHKLDYLEKISDFDDNIGRADYLKRAGTILAPLKGDPTLELYLPKVSNVSGISTDGVLREVMGTEEGRGDNLSPAENSPDGLLPPAAVGGRSYERIVISGLINGLFEIDPNVELQFSTGLHRKLYDIILLYREQDKQWRQSHLEIEDFDEEDVEKIKNILSTDDAEVKRNYYDALRKMQKDALDARIATLTAKFNEAKSAEKAQYSQLIKVLLHEKRQLK